MEKIINNIRSICLFEGAVYEQISQEFLSMSARQSCLDMHSDKDSKKISM